MTKAKTPTKSRPKSVKARSARRRVDPVALADRAIAEFLDPENILDHLMADWGGQTIVYRFHEALKEYQQRQRSGFSRPFGDDNDHESEVEDARTSGYLLGLAVARRLAGGGR